MILINPYCDLRVNLKAHAEAGLFVAKPIEGLFGRERVIPCARRYNLPDGRFGGVVVASVTLDHF